MKSLRCGLVLLLVSISLTVAAAVEVRSLRMWHAPERTRVVFDLTAPVQYHAETLSNPDRLFIDLPTTDFTGVLPDPRTNGPLIQRIRLGVPRPGVTRIVFDLTGPVVPKSFLLSPNQSYGNRLVLDLYTKDTTARAPAAPPSRASPEVVVIVDPGHGGEDFGASGRRRTREKDVVLSVAKKLARKIDNTPGMRAVLTRTGDYYVSLRQRTDIARRHNADLFLSVHADAFQRSTVRGSSVYALSRRGASSETARWLADKENSADLVGGVSLKDKDDLLAQVLLDLSMTKTISDSLSFGRDVLAEFKRIGPVHSPRVEQAGFVVLKSPDIPSILVELAYISNPTEEKLLRTARFQDQIADGMLRGIKRYLSHNPVARADAPPVQ